MISGTRFYVVPDYSEHKMLSGTRFYVVPDYSKHEIIPGTRLSMVPDHSRSQAQERRLGKMINLAIWQTETVNTKG